MYRFSFYILLITIVSVVSCKSPVNQSVSSHNDVKFLQDYSIKYYTETNAIPSHIATDRNGRIQVLDQTGLLHTQGGQLLIPGALVPDHTYRFMTDKEYNGLTSLDNQLVYLTNEAIISNAWAGELYFEHSLPKARLIGGHLLDQKTNIVPERTAFIISDGNNIEYLSQQGSLWKGKIENDTTKVIRYSKSKGSFILLAGNGLYEFNVTQKQLNKIAEGSDFTHFDFGQDEKTAVVGTTNGYLVIDLESGKQVGDIERKLPVTNITAVANINGTIWMGTNEGAFSKRADNKYNYYYGERWLPGNQVIDIVKGNGDQVLILTNRGLGKIVFEEMTLQEKAMYFEQQVRDRHIRNGFNASLRNMQKGNIATGYLGDSDNDGLWTAMYLGGQAFRYAVTKDSDALQNCRESLDAMERLYTITPVPGFPARSYERSGHINELSDPERWQHSAHKDWDWKATTSSDEAIGHIFAFGVLAELVDDEEIRNKSIMLIDTLMSHIITNDLYLIDYDGKPTLWGKWNPEYVNAFPINVGDRKLNSSNIIGMLQTAYHFTKKEKYKEKAFELMEKHGYLENMMRPMEVIGRADENADDYSKMLSDGWNHSDDEMYFLGYWGLYRYAFNDTLKAQYKESILDHYEAERPEKEGLWNIFTAITGVGEFDLDHAIWYLQEYPLDLIDWSVANSHRKDIELIEPNFRKQTTKEVLPPDERPIARHNANTFTLDRKYGNGTGEHSAGDIWLLPYWMGRYLNVISEPASK